MISESSIDDKYFTVDFIKECFIEERGKLFWIKRPLKHFASLRSCNVWNTQNIGAEAGCYHSGHHRWRVSIKGRRIFRYRIVWLLHHNEWPKFDIDHKNRDKLDDRIDNLRLTTQSYNSANSKIPKNNTSGVKGVRWNESKNKWTAEIMVNYKHIYLGRFDDIQSAKEAYINAARKYFGQFASNGEPDVVLSAS